MQMSSDSIDTSLLVGLPLEFLAKKDVGEECLLARNVPTESSPQVILPSHYSVPNAINVAK